VNCNSQVPISDQMAKNDADVVSAMKLINDTLAAAATLDGSNTTPKPPMTVVTTP
jgi:hypothetical protein